MKCVITNLHIGQIISIGTHQHNLKAGNVQFQWSEILRLTFFLGRHINPNYVVTHLKIFAQQ